ncbi:MAG TPA: hypothetical protein PKA41_05555 [Verrucomicrobiota bacterium]|nr:hypothetical protein [Verrucomicrobiota bacterium]
MKDSQITLVCFALKEEAGPFRRACAGRDGVSILLTGIGQANASRAVANFLSKQSPALVFTCGFAGGLNPQLTTGDVVFSTEGGTIATRLTSAGATQAHVFCAERVAVTVAEKHALREQTGADAVEMESGAIQSLCRERGIPCATVRVISDTANEDLPLDFNQLSKPDKNLDFGKLAVTLLKRPGKIPALLRLQKNCSLASRNLSDVLMKVV